MGFSRNLIQGLDPGKPLEKADGEAQEVANSVGELMFATATGGASDIAAPSLPTDTPGFFPNLGTVDLTTQYPGLSYGEMGKVRNLVMHSTDAYTGESTLNTYETRSEEGSSIGAHYLIDESGVTYLTVPTDKAVGHTKGTDPEGVYYNDNSIGIEHTKYHTSLDPNTDLHAQISELDLAPEFKESLTSMSNEALQEYFGPHGYILYEDINGAQKRSTWKLSQQLATTYGLDLSTDVHAHELLQGDKKPGEGESITEFIGSMTSMDDRIAQLTANLDACSQGGPQGISEKIQEAVLGIQLKHYQQLSEDIAKDGTPLHQLMLQIEQTLGATGPATAREERLVEFYDNFWPEMQKLDATVAGSSELCAPAYSPAAQGMKDVGSALHERLHKPGSP